MKNAGCEGRSNGGHLPDSQKLLVSTISRETVTMLDSVSVVEELFLP
jgi:hypothetical protein